MKLRLNTVGNSRKSLARIIREYADGTMDSQKARDLAYLFSHYLGYFKLEKDCEIEKRLELIEEHLNSLGGI